MKRSALALCAGLLVLGLMPGSALATSGVLDQSNASTGLSAGTSGMLAQTFTAGKTGSLTEVDLYMEGDNAHAINVTIQATTGGLPNGTVLATSGFGTPPNVVAWVPFSISSQPSITSGTMYAIVFSPGAYNAVKGSPNTYSPARHWPTTAARGSPRRRDCHWTSPSRPTLALPFRRQLMSINRTGRPSQPARRIIPTAISLRPSRPASPDP